MLNLSEATKRMLDLSTAHLTQQDAKALEAGEILGPRIVSHRHGWVVYVTSDPDAVRAAVGLMRQTGASEAFIKIYESACKMGGDYMLINFDQDAETLDGLETFDW
jgi:hypothetical protein